jgi:glutamate/tyrosine decarboxylase-like PLP-dependent enzyme
MSAISTRPSTSELAFHLYARLLHPELFVTLAERVVRREDYILTVRITTAGHVLSWCSPRLQLTEVTFPTDELLPLSGRLCKRRFLGEQRETRQFRDGIRYSMNAHVETLPPEQFVAVHDEILADSKKRGLVFHHRPNRRLGLEPLGYITADANRTSLCVAAFHTFPEEYAIVRTQSLIERTGDA